MLPFSRQHSVPLGAKTDVEKDAKPFLHPSVSSSSLAPASSSPPSQPNFNRSGSSNSRRARSLLALALTLLALVLVSVATRGQSRGTLSSQDEAAGALPRHSSLLSSSPSVARRRPLPSASAAVVAAALASAEDEANKKSDAGFPLAAVRAPLLTQAELLTLQHYARGSVYAEWGSGASTVLVAPMARRAVSIENQKSWCDEMVASADVDFWIKNNVLTYLCVDTGPTGSFGTPTGASDPRLFGRYLDALDDAAAAVTSKATRTTATTLAAGAQKQVVPAAAAAASSASSSTDAFTVVLVDGRFRVACALKALWHLDHARGVLLVHDWVARAERYHAPILRRYSLVAVVDRLAVLVPSSPPSLRQELEGEESGDDDYEEARARWWAEAAEEMEKYSRDAA